MQATFHSWKSQIRGGSYVFIFYSEPIDTYWVIPSSHMVKPGFCNRLKSGQNMGRYRIMLTNYSQAKKVIRPRPKYEGYINAFEQALGRPSQERREE